MKADKILKFFYEKRNAFVLLLLLAIVALAFWLRIHDLGLKDLWIDEYFTDDGAFYTFKKLWAKGHTRTTLLFSLIMKYYAAALGFFTKRPYMTPFELRVPNVVYGTVLVALVYFVVKKFSDIFTGIFASLLCATSAYLVYYSRDGRYYPFMLLWVLVCFWASVYILKEPLYSKKQIKYHIVYMICGICGMFSHYGFWLYFAASNVALCLIMLYRFFADPAEDSFLRKAGKSSLMVAAMAVPVLLVPNIVYKRYGSGVSAVFSEKMRDNTHLLNSLSLNSLSSFYQDFFSDFKDIALFIFVAFTVISLLLLIFNKERRIILYLMIVKFGTFILLRLTPRRIVVEPLRTRYLIFLILIDLVIFALFAGELIKYISKAFSFISKKLFMPIYLLLAIAVLASTAYGSLKLLPKSDMRIYVPFNRPSQAIERIKELYRDGDVVVTDYMDLFYAVPYAQKFDSSLGNVKCFFVGWMTNPPSDCDRIILITKKKIKGVPGIIALGKTNTLFFNLLFLPDDLRKEDIGYLLSQIIDSDHGDCRRVLSSWAGKKTNVLDYLHSTSQPKDLISNSDFANGFEGWRVTEEGWTKISLTNFNKSAAVMITGQGGWSTLSQSFDIEEGKSYRIIVEARSEDWQDDIKLICRFTDAAKNNNYYDLVRVSQTKDWIRFTKRIDCGESGRATLCLQYSNKTKEGVIFVKEMKFIEYRDVNAKYEEKPPKVGKPENSMIYDGDFKSGYAHWKGGFDLDYEHFRMIYSDGEVYLKLLNQPKENRWFNLHQHFPAQKGDVYELSFDYRYYGNASKDGSAFFVFSQLSNGKHTNEKYIQINTKATGNIWKRQKQKLTVSASKEACLRLQFMGDPDCEVKNVQLIRTTSDKSPK